MEKPTELGHKGLQNVFSSVLNETTSRICSNSESENVR